MEEASGDIAISVARVSVFYERRDRVVAGAVGACRPSGPERPVA
jgi:hypothetical protein